MPFFEKITKYQVHCSNQARIPELLSRCFDYAMLERGPTQFNIPRDLFYGEFDARYPSPIRVERRPGGPGSPGGGGRTARRQAEFPVILSGGGSRHVRRRRRRRQARRAPRRRLWSTPTCTTTASPGAIRLWTGPIGYQGSKAAMKLLAQADVVLALGTRLGPFGTLPQHGIDYWPKDAKLIQVDMNPRKLGLGEAGRRRHLRRRQSRRRRDPAGSSRPATAPSRRMATRSGASPRSTARRPTGKPS